MLRIISGIHRSRQLEQPDMSISRPTMDRVREAIFNSIRMNIKDKIVLDLFAGSGAFAFEAISNGAMKVFCVENNKNAINVIRNNKNTLKANNVQIEYTDVLNFLNSNQGKEFDYIFIDAPYLMYETVNQTLELINEFKYLNKNGLIIVETNDSKQIMLPKGLTIQNYKKYGKVDILYISNNN
ncbi:16S rRNA (guanine(966)-N(2))-methyltransferase RsmD [Mycoplasmopsis iners]|uniref:16S rRNA (guanine(966)-N(2))-methyltransferase RsmD n=1 Tax=Mycoplasmopsis iners TaxID=76630 RepID=UPI00049721A4|nr:16S rRNA (guanine(966)-N(2))-methyltransferase RsmD [Mycoplasmopsis iners]